MQPGIFARTFVRPLDEVFAAVARLGLRTVQFNFASAGLPSLPRHMDAEIPERIRKAAASHRIAIAAVSGTFNMAHPDPKRRREGLQGLEVIAGTCARLGAGIITLCTGTRHPEDMWRRHPDNDSTEAWHDLVITLTKALTTADKHEVTLAIEPELGNIVDGADKARRLLDELRSPRLKVVIDAANLVPPGNLARMTEVLEHAFDLLGPDLVMAHAKDLHADGRVGGLPLGRGVLDWNLYLDLLHQARFTGPLIMHGFVEREASASVRFLRDKLASLKDN